MEKMYIRPEYAECDENCEDNNCPYTYITTWNIWEDGSVIKGPFISEQAANIELASILLQQIPLNINS
jgi:hypothetical protein